MFPMKPPHRHIVASLFLIAILAVAEPAPRLASAQTDDCQTDIDAGMEILRRPQRNVTTVEQACAAVPELIEEYSRARAIFENARCDTARRNKEVEQVDQRLKLARDAYALSCRKR
jgi:hypothetical protein